MLFYYVASHLMLFNKISNEVEDDWLKKYDVLKNTVIIKKMLNINYQMKIVWRELNINYFVLYIGKQKVNERKNNDEIWVNPSSFNGNLFWWIHFIWFMSKYFHNYQTSYVIDPVLYERK